MENHYEFRFLQEKHAEKIVEWNQGGPQNCRESQAFLTQWAGRAFTYPITNEQVLSDMDACDTVFEINLKGKMIGTIAILTVDEAKGSAYIGHVLLDPKCTGKGHGTAALHEFVSYCFGILKLKRLELRVFAYNTAAVRCYKANGFQIAEKSQTGDGLEVWLMTLEKEKEKSTKDTPVTICKETEEDYKETELMTQHAFWNLHCPGCDEHLLVADLRKSKDYLREISQIAKVNGRVVGTIMYEKAYVSNDQGKRLDIITFGPLCVEPACQSLDIGGKLLETTMQMAKEAGYPAIIIFGEPGYYPRHGFVTCDQFGITTSEGKNFDAFMGIELQPGALSGITGKFYEPEVLSPKSKEKVAKFNRRFPELRKYHLPGQWA